MYSLLPSKPSANHQLDPDMIPRRLLLRDLPFSARLTLAAFLIAVGIGYVSALVQLHLQHSSPQNMLPSNDDVIRHFHGASGEAKSPLQRLLEASESMPFNGSGSMAAAHTTRSDGWKRAIKDFAKEKSLDEAKAEAELRKERDGERLATLAWVKAGCPAAEFEADKFLLPVDWGQQPMTASYREGDSVKIKSLFSDRCVRCHAKEGDDAQAASYPLETMEHIQKYAKIDTGGGRVSLDKLAQTTHAHLLSFAVLFTFTGLLFALTNYPALIRVVLSPVVLVAQVLEIGCWWLARLDGSTGEAFARTIPILGAIVGAGLGLQIVLTLLHLFGALGRLVLVALFVAAGYVGYVAKEKVVVPFISDRTAEVKKAN